MSIPQPQLTSLQSLLPLRPDANVRPTLPPIRKVLKGVCPDENVTLDRDSTPLRTSDTRRTDHTNVHFQDRFHPEQNRPEKKVRFE